MIQKEQVFVRALNKNGEWGSVDVLDLDNDSFKAFILGKLFECGIVIGIKSEDVTKGIVLKEKKAIDM